MARDSTTLAQKHGVRKDKQRSRTGCAECRTRKVKCDEARPQCGQCKRGKRDCSILDSIFRPHPWSIVTAGSSTSASAETEEPEPPPPPPPPAAEPSAPVPLVHESPSFSLGSIATPLSTWNGTPTALPRNPSLTSHAASPPFLDSPTATSAVRSFEQLPPILDKTAWPNSILSPPILPGIRSNPLSESPGTRFSDLLPQTAPKSVNSSLVSSIVPDGADAVEVAFFIRQYAEGLGRGMDLVGYGQYFTRQALLLARDSELIRFAACAAAAKQLGHMKDGAKQAKNTNATQVMAKTLQGNGLDYLWYGAKYYGRAIQSMATELAQPESSVSPSAPGEDFSHHVGSTLPALLTSGRSDAAEARFLAACIMCRYEQLSASVRAWSSHLNGIMRFLCLDDSANLPIAAPMIQPGSCLRSLFWHFVQCDFEESFIKSKPTRVNTEQLPLWRDRGLPLDDAGDLIPGCFLAEQWDDSTILTVIALHTMIRLVCKVSNFICARASLPNTRWVALTAEIDAWYAALPPSFRPDIARTQDPDSTSEFFVDEVWFTNGACALAHLYYHMAKILLLIYQPKDLLAGRGPGDMMTAYNDFHRQLVAQARALLGIALGQPDDSVRMHMLQPLYVAGRCLNKEPDQRALVDMLKSIEHDLGIATGYRVKQLVDEWGASGLHAYSELDHELSDLSGDD